jgi:hypothetical protein
VAKPCNGLHSQTIPEAAKESHLPKLCRPGGDKDIGFDATKNFEKERDFCGIMLAVGIQSDDHLIVFLEDILESRPKGSSLSEITGVLQELDSIF